jgi:hypothetical protein
VLSAIHGGHDLACKYHEAAVCALTDCMHVYSPIQLTIGVAAAHLAPRFTP